MIIKGSKPDWIKTPAAPVVAVVWDMCWPAATLHPQQRVCCSLSDVDGWCSDEPAVRTLNLLHCNVLVLPRTTPVLKSIPLISHTDSNRTAHGSRVKQSHICFFHKLFLYCWYHVPCSPYQLPSCSIRDRRHISACPQLWLCVQAVLEKNNKCLLAFNHTAEQCCLPLSCNLCWRQSTKEWAKSPAATEVLHVKPEAWGQSRPFSKCSHEYYAHWMQWQTYFIPLPFALFFTLIY